MPIDLGDALSLFGRLDILAGVVQHDRVALSLDSRVSMARPIVADPAPVPSRVQKDLHALEANRGDPRAHDSLLYVVPRLTRSLEAAALIDHRVQVAAIDEGRVIVDGQELTAASPNGDTETHRPRGRRPWGRYAVVRALLRTDRPRTQEALAAEAGVSQQATAKTLQWLAPNGVRRAHGGWVAEDASSLWQHHQDAYPGPGGLRRAWVGVGAVADQLAAAQQAAGDTETLVSGDAGADRLAPWRRPRRSVIYAPRDLDLSAKLAPAGPGDVATLEVVVPDDQTIFATARAYADGSPQLTDPVLTAWEVLRSPGPDARQAAGSLAAFVLNRRVLR